MNLTFQNVTKFYGPVIGVNDISCQIGPGVTALFGANGAGKSTMIKLASGQLRPSQGNVNIGEKSSWSTAAKRDFGYSPDINSFYEEMTGREFVTTMSRLYGYASSEAKRRTELALLRVGMADRAARRIAGYSHGMRQRIKLAQALTHDPQILLLDEPLTGVDPGGRADFHQLLAQLADDGKTILFSTHMLAEVEDICDSVLMISRGRLLASGSLSQIRSLLADQPLTVEIAAVDARHVASLLLQMPEVRSVEIDQETVTVRTTNASTFFPAINELVVEQQLDISRMQTVDEGADAVFSYLEAGA
ncbi:MAG: ABC transporter ATP-binding protein [Pirellulales bacterium]|nr:ABC transporter ATP-binding protein [Pirellulales bacterium]